MGPIHSSGVVTARKRSLGQGNIFTPVCHSVHRGACVVALGGVGTCVVAWGGMRGCSWGGMHGSSWGVHGCSGGHAWLLPGGRHAWLLGRRAWDTTKYGDTVNERVVRILLECILVYT